MDIRELKSRGEMLFSKSTTLMLLFQTLAENFYPERANFTVTHTLGEEFGVDLMTSYPVMCRRELGNSFSSILRPAGEDWFEPTINYEERLDHDGKLWLQRAGKIQRRAMYDREANFIRATKEGDHDFACFGQTVISTQMNRNRDALNYQCWHLRDCRWCEDDEGKIDLFVRKWRPYAIDLVRKFPKTVSAKTRAVSVKNPYEEIECMHIVCGSHNYDAMPDDSKRLKNYPYISVFIECTDAHKLEEVGLFNSIYTIPRWQTVSGSQYAYSPASIVALADARMIQSMTAVLLEAGEKAVTPPMVARQNVIRSDMPVYAGGTIWVDSEYDERNGRPVDLLVNDKSGVPLGRDMQMDVRQMLSQAFFLNKLTMPAPQGEGTAYEMSQLVKEYIRGALPLFEPMEINYNGALCENTFDVMFRMGAFGPIDQIPKSLSKADIRFKFKTPLQDAQDAKKGITLQQSKQLIATVIDLDPSSANIMDVKKSLREALEGIGQPESWRRSEQEVEDMTAQQAEDQANQKLLDQVQQGSEIAKNASAALPPGSMTDVQR